MLTNRKNLSSQSEKSAVQVFAILGLLISIAVNTYLAMGPFTGLMENNNRMNIRMIMGVTILVQMISAILVAVGFARLIILLKGKVLISIPVGALVGAIAGGISFGLTIATMFAMAVPVKAIQFATEINTWPWWKIFGNIFLNSSWFGVMAGIPLGAVAAPILSRKIRQKKQSAKQ